MTRAGLEFADTISIRPLAPFLFRATQAWQFQPRFVVRRISSAGIVIASGTYCSILPVSNQLADCAISSSCLVMKAKGNDSSISFNKDRWTAARCLRDRMVMNFRSIDPRDGRKGLSGINIVDREVWNNYFNTGNQQLNVEQLNRDFETIWGGTAAKVEPRTEVTHISEPPEAPDDDIGRKRWVSQTYRKGQPAFRKRLLHLYDGTCAITGVAIEAVLDAAHIVDHSKMGINNSDNGLLLRSDIHDLFDCGLIRLDPDNCQVQVDESLEDTSYWKYHKRQIRQRIDGSRPSKELIALKNRATGQKSCNDTT